MRSCARAALIGLMVAVSACAVDQTSESSPDPSSASSPREEEDPVATAIDEAVPPQSLPGDDQVFLERATGNLDDAGIDLALSEDQLVERGRYFCSILTGGGMVGAKVDIWSGTIDFYEGSAEVFDAALDTYCPTLRDGYTAIRLGDGSAGPSSEDRGDLTRFFLEVRRTGLDHLTDGELARDAAAVCLAPPGARWLTSKDVRRTMRSVPPRHQTEYLLALTLGYCDQRIDELEKAFGTTQQS